MTELKVKLSKPTPKPPPAVDTFPADQKAFEGALGPYKSKSSQSTTTPGMMLDYIYVIDGDNLNVARVQAATSVGAQYSSGADNSSFGNNTNGLIKATLLTFIDGLMNGFKYADVQKIKAQNKAVMSAIALQNSLSPMLIDASASFSAGSQAQAVISQAISTSLEKLDDKFTNPIIQQTLPMLSQAQAGGAQCIALSAPIIIMAFMKPDLMKMGNGIITISTAFTQVLQGLIQGLTNSILSSAKSMLDSVQ